MIYAFLVCNDGDCNNEKRLDCAQSLLARMEMKRSREVFSDMQRLADQGRVYCQNGKAVMAAASFRSARR